MSTKPSETWYVYSRRATHDDLASPDFNAFATEPLVGRVLEEGKQHWRAEVAELVPLVESGEIVPTGELVDIDKGNCRVFNSVEALAKATRGKLL